VLHRRLSGRSKKRKDCSKEHDVYHMCTPRLPQSVPLVLPSWFGLLPMTLGPQRLVLSIELIHWGSIEMSSAFSCCWIDMLPSALCACSLTVGACKCMQLRIVEATQHVAMRDLVGGGPCSGMFLWILDALSVARVYMAHELQHSYN
jgi:hypothetical protein